ncbi:hypothetical protein ALQ60_00459 [Pseudomonas syringae pv. papulans]|nr:Uncharacterized protein ALO65_03616 [Pseudomonas syringae pv. papulans]KWS42861.1 hypothetical protein AL059_17215 [Pseudomonas syringae pv. papulans]RMN37792.1 hypothetical protein ALQ60_00459 [Pseudomonas syringae pv. papulans]RMV38261.1 hypothetical protein ALP11_02032 [Pseudomonas syringae pv. papulans]
MRLNSVGTGLRFCLSIFAHIMIRQTVAVLMIGNTDEYRLVSKKAFSVYDLAIEVTLNMLTRRINA